MCLASRQFLGALALVSGAIVLGVWVSVLSRVSVMLSRPCSQDKAVSRHFSYNCINKFKFKVVTFYAYYSNRPHTSIAKKVGCGIHTVVV